MKFKMDHTAIAVSNLKKSIAWYGLLGFRKVRQFERPDLQAKFAVLKLGQNYLELIQPEKQKKVKKEFKKLETSLPNLGYQHTGIQVANIEQAVKYLKKHKINSTQIKIGKTSRYAFCNDPDGILVEIKENFK